MAILDQKERRLLALLIVVFTPLSFLAYSAYKSFFPGNFLGFVGSLFVLRLTYNALLLPLFRLATRRPKVLSSYGSWAVVTGCTSGMGERFAHRLAAEGLNILLVSRTQSKLDKIASDIKSACVARGAKPVETRTLAYDFGTGDEAYDKKFEAELNALLPTLSGGSVGVLVNNVGGSNDDATLLHEISDADIKQMLRVNNDGTMRMTRALLPLMVKNRKGAIICVSSASCTHPTPLLAAYSATKAFGNQLTRSLYYEYKEFGIDCLSVTPYYFVSEMFKRKDATFMAPFPDKIIDAALPLLGYEPEAYPYYFHWFMGNMFRSFPEPGYALLWVMKRSKARADAKKAKKSN